MCFKTFSTLEGDHGAVVGAVWIKKFANDIKIGRRAFGEEDYVILGTSIFEETLNVRPELYCDLKRVE